MNVLVVGKAKTGTTVISKAIQHSLNDAKYFLEPKNISFFESEPGNCSKVIKIIFEHWDKCPHLRDGVIFNETKLKFDKKIAIIRDPRDEMISRLFYFARGIALNGGDRMAMESWIKIIQQKEQDPASMSFAKMAEKFYAVFGTKMAPNTARDLQYFSWVKRLSRQLTAIKYEDFITGKIDELEKYLGITLSKNRDLGNLTFTKRSGRMNNWKSFFVAEDVDLLKPAYGPLLTEMGYTDWNLEPVERLDPREGSEYIRRITDEIYEKNQNS